MKRWLWVAAWCGLSACATTKTAQVDGETVQYESGPFGGDNTAALLRAVREKDEAEARQAAQAEKERQEKEAEERVRIKAAWEEGWQQGDPLDEIDSHGLYKNASEHLKFFEEKMEWLTAEFERNGYSEEDIERWTARMNYLKKKFIEDKGRTTAFQSDDMGDPEHFKWCTQHTRMDYRHDPRTVYKQIGEQVTPAYRCSTERGIRDCRRVDQGILLINETQIFCSKYQLQMVNRFRNAPWFIDQREYRIENTAGFLPQYRE